MPSTEVPYAADAEQSLSYDELEVSLYLYWTKWLRVLADRLGAVTLGAKITIREGARGGACHCTVEVQLCLGLGEKPAERTSGAGCEAIAGCVSTIFDSCLALG